MHPIATFDDEKKARFVCERERESKTNEEKREQNDHKKQQRASFAIRFSRQSHDDFTYCVRVVGAFGSIENGRPVVAFVSLRR